MTVSELLEHLQSFDPKLEIEVLTDKNKKSQIKDVREGASHFVSDTTGETEETKFILIII